MTKYLHTMIRVSSLEDTIAAGSAITRARSSA